MSAAAILKLQAAGFTVEQVTAIAELIDTQSATRADLDATEHRLELKIQEVENRLNLKIEALDRRLDLKITALQGEMVLLKWMMGFVLAFQIAIFAKMFLH
jgi:DNA-binding transcriptional MerR regulator